MKMRQAGLMIAGMATTEEFALDAMFFLSEIDKASQGRPIGFLGMIRSQLPFELHITRSQFRGASPVHLEAAASEQKNRKRKDNRNFHPGNRTVIAARGK
jgi:hypothetical protein